jgi:mono/diheme cytochrome c family protein
VLRRVVDAVQVVALVCAAVFVVLLFANEPDDGGAAGGGEVSGQEVYADHCARCHGAEGEGGRGPTLAGGAVVEEYPEVEDQLDVVREGRGTMPAFGRRLSAEELRAVVDYTREELP